jgi:hypothetical protein
MFHRFDLVASTVVFEEVVLVLVHLEEEEEFIHPL